MSRFAVSLLCVLALAPAALAQMRDTCRDNCTGFTAKRRITADTTLRRAYPGTNFFVGDPAATQTTPVTLTIEKGSVITGGISTEENADNDSVYGVNVYGDNRVAVRGGDTSSVRAYNKATIAVSSGTTDAITANNNATVNVQGGKVALTYIYDSGTLDISGGKSDEAAVYHTATMNISGGTVEYVEGVGAGNITVTGGTVGEVMAHGYNADIRGGAVRYVVSSPLCYSKVNIRGGDIAGGIVLCGDSASVNFDGTNLRYEYAGIAAFRTQSAEGEADKFVVSGTFAGKDASYSVFIPCNTGNPTENTPNAAPRQFTFNHAAVAAPLSATWICGAILYAASALLIVLFWLRRR